MAAEKTNLSDSLKKLSEIVKWFDDQKEADIETGLEKVKDGAELIRSCRQRLSEIENEFEEIEKKIDKELK